MTLVDELAKATMSPAEITVETDDFPVRVWAVAEGQIIFFRASWGWSAGRGSTKAEAVLNAMRVVSAGFTGAVPTPKGTYALEADVAIGGQLDVIGLEPPEQAAIISYAIGYLMGAALRDS